MTAQLPANGPPRSPSRLHLDEELRAAGLQPTPLGTRAYRLDDRTPAHSFTTVIAALTGGECCLTMTARDWFDEGLALAILTFVDSAEDRLTLGEVSQIITGFHHDHHGFDAVMLLGPRAHQAFQTRNERLHSLTLEAFPIFRCEFSGNEPAELVDLIRHHFVSTVDWKREASPQLRLRFHNTRTGVRSTGRELGLARPSTLETQLRQLTDAPGSFIEVGNFLGEQCRVTVAGERFVVALPGSADPLALARPDMTAWMRGFLIGGLGTAAGGARYAGTGSPGSSGSRFGLFLTDYPRERTILSEHPLETDGARILEEFDRLSDTRGCNLGVVRGDGLTLQLYWNEDSTLLADVPAPDRGGSFAKLGTHAECRHLLESFLTGAGLDAMPDLTFSSWR